MAGPVERLERLLRALGVEARVREFDEDAVRELAKTVYGSDSPSLVEEAKRIAETIGVVMVCPCDEGIEIIVGGPVDDVSVERAALKAYIISRSGRIDVDCEGGDEREACMLASTLLDAMADLIGRRLLGEDYWLRAKAKMREAAVQAIAALEAGRESLFLEGVARIYYAVYEKPPKQLARIVEEYLRDPTPETATKLINTILHAAGILLHAEPKEDGVVLRPARVEKRGWAT